MADGDLDPGPGFSPTPVPDSGNHADPADLPMAGCFAGPEHRLPIRVYFEDTDLSGVVYHANYLRWMERGRSEMLRQIGVDQRAAHESGEGAYVVADLAIRYQAPARLNDLVVVASRLIMIRSASCRIHQRVMRNGLILADATVTAAFVAPSGRPRRQPAAWLAAFERYVCPGV